jgi:hypothetical protein
LERAKRVRRFVFQYNGNEKARDIEDDPGGGMETPSIGSIIRRHDREWKVVHVVAPVSPNGTIPIVRVFLNDTTRIRGRTFSANRAAA